MSFTEAMNIDRSQILKTVRSCLDRNGTSEDIDPLLLLRGLLLGRIL